MTGATDRASRYFVGPLVIVIASLTACGRTKPSPDSAHAVLSDSVVSSASVSGADDSGADVRPTKLNAAHLPNAIRLDSSVISGGLPEGEAAFAELKALGVRTIISVDGAKPDVASAAKFGLRYVHLPHGYDGISPERVRELAKAVTELDGPLYIHCHHGKHRSPAAASAACVTAGRITPSTALSVLELAGTNPQYRGLYASVRSARPMSPDELSVIQVDYHATVEVPPLAEAMVALEHTHDHLKQLAESGWRPLAKHPDLDAAHEALLFREHYTELLRLPEVDRRPAEFRAELAESEATARELEQQLADWSADRPGTAPELVTATFKRATAQCKVCHEKFRDNGASTASR